MYLKAVKRQKELKYREHTVIYSMIASIAIGRVVYRVMHVFSIGITSRQHKSETKI